MPIPFSWPIRVYYEDTDCGGVVYNANYLNFMERARTEWMRERGIEQDAFREKYGLLFAVRSASLNFIKPARFNQQLSVEVILKNASRIRFGFEQNIRLQPEGSAHCDAGPLLCQGEFEIICADAQKLTPRRIPSVLFEEIVREH